MADKHVRKLSEMDRPKDPGSRELAKQGSRSAVVQPAQVRSLPSDRKVKIVKDS